MELAASKQPDYDGVDMSDDTDRRKRKHDQVDFNAALPSFDSSDHIGYIANRVLWGTYYTVFYVVLLIFQLVLFCVGIAQYVVFRELNSHDLWYVIADTVVTVLMAAEVTIRYLASRERFWNSCLNVADFIICVLCVAALFAYFLDPQTAVYGSFVLAVRYAAQLVRLLLMLKRHRDRKAAVASMATSVDFTQLDEEDANRHRAWATLDQDST